MRGCCRVNVTGRSDPLLSRRNLFQNIASCFVSSHRTAPHHAMHLNVYCNSPLTHCTSPRTEQLFTTYCAPHHVPHSTSPFTCCTSPCTAQHFTTYVLHLTTYCTAPHHVLRASSRTALPLTTYCTARQHLRTAPHHVLHCASPRTAVHLTRY